MTDGWTRSCQRCLSDAAGVPPFPPNPHEGVRRRKWSCNTVSSPLVVRFRSGIEAPPNNRSARRRTECGMPQENPPEGLAATRACEQFHVAYDLSWCDKARATLHGG